MLYHSFMEGKKMKKNKLLISGVFLSLILFVSCASKNTSAYTTGIENDVHVCKNLRPVYITNSKKVYLLSPEHFDYPVDTIQKIEGTYGNKSFSMLAYIQSDFNGISVSLFNNFGVDMGNLSFSKEKASFTSSIFEGKLLPEYIICDIQNAIYDSKALYANYQAAGLEFSNVLIDFEVAHPVYGAWVEERTVYEGNTVIEEIYISSGRIDIKNHLRGYSYTLTSAEGS